MTSTGMVTTAVEQALFRLGGDGDASIVASSLDEGRTRTWFSLIAPHLRRARVPAFAYHTFEGGRAAAVLRTQDPVHPGFGYVHALLATEQELTAGFALSSSDWPGWRAGPPAGSELPRLRSDDVIAPDSLRRLHAYALTEGDLLARMVAVLLSAPNSPIGLVGVPEQARVPLLWALHEIVAPVLPQRPWTFSTRTVADGAAIVFVDEPVDDLVPQNRHLVDLRRDQPADERLVEQANALVYRFEYGVEPALPAAQPTAPNQPTVPDPFCAKLVRDVVTAKDVRALDGALVELESAVRRVDDRDNVRRALADAGWADGVIRRHVSFAEWDLVFGRVVQIAFGATSADRVTAAAHADAYRVAETSSSTELVRAVARHAWNPDLAEVLARRWLAEHENDAAKPKSRGWGWRR